MYYLRNIGTNCEMREINTIQKKMKRIIVKEHIVETVIFGFLNLSH